MALIVPIVPRADTGWALAIPPGKQAQIAEAVKHDAQVVSSTQLDEKLKGERPAVREEIVRINKDATHRALQWALLVPILASLLGLLNSFRMLRLPDVAPRAAKDEVALA